MCTVSYISTGSHSFILTSNRDEAPKRASDSITHSTKHQQKLLFPRDKGAGGTWVAASETGRVTCLLNGAFKKHMHQPPYVRSRGAMVLESFSYNSISNFITEYDTAGMEPFTLVLADGQYLYELRWDGKQKYPKALDARGMYIWSSATLYPAQIREKREKWFEDWRDRRTDFNQSAILALHRNGGKGDIHNAYVMNRNDVVCTVSITSIKATPVQIRMSHHDLLAEQTHEASLSIRD